MVKFNKNTKLYSNTYDKYDICRVLNNTESYFCRCAGYCRHHSCFVTFNQIKNRKCDRRGCIHFVRKED